MAIHLLAATSIPKSVFTTLEAMFANFLWGSSELGKRKHWLAWHKLCTPVREGGLGFRRLIDVKHAFLLKQCWNLCTNSSIWTTFLKSKYKLLSPPVSWSGPQRCSVEFKNILAITKEFSNHCSWTIGRGDVSFWYDRWHPEFLLDLLRPNEDIQLKLRDLQHNGVWLFDDLLPTLGPSVVQALFHHAPRLSENDDKRHWAPEKSGRFSTKSAWEVVRHRQPLVHILDDIWATPMPPATKIICWRLIRNIIPVDVRAQHNGISIASKCVCCSVPGCEFLDHLFVHGELAHSLWSYFSTMFAVPYFPMQSISSRIKWWFWSCKGNSHFSIMGRLACLAICRQIWSYRNNLIYGGMHKDFMHARMVVVDALQHVDTVVTPRMLSSKYGIDSLKALGITPKSPKAKRISLCAWTPPLPGSFSLNVDGSCRGDHMAVGGVIRNHKGDVVCAFAGPKGVGTSFQGEILALSLGADLVNDLQLHATVAYTDSLSLAMSIGKASPLWRTVNIWEEMSNSLYNIPVRHCFRESNHVADALSKLGHSLPQIRYFFASSELPADIQKLLWMDKMGFWFCRNS